MRLKMMCRHLVCRLSAGRRIINQHNGQSVFVVGVVSAFVAIGSIGCEAVTTDGISPGYTDSLRIQLQDEYSEFEAPKTPPDNAFVSSEDSHWYTFWDGGHISFGNGQALNTADEKYQGIAIISYYVNLDTKADEVMDNYFTIIADTGDVVPISSAYRNPARNDLVSDNPNSLHMYGQAIDFDNDNTDPPTQAQNIWDAAGNMTTSPSQLYNVIVAEEKIYYKEYRPVADDQLGDTHWIHVAWGNIYE